MLKKKQNLSSYNLESMPSGEALSGQRYAIAVSDWNTEITHSLLAGAVETFVNLGVINENIDVVHVPGAFELVYAAKEFVNSYSDKTEGAKNKKYSAVIIIGCVIQGETPHFDYICQGVTAGIAQLNATPAACPVIYGLLTTLDMEQAKDRAGGKHGNKGVEAAVTAVKMGNIIW